MEEAAKLRRTVFVGNLPSAVKRKMVQREFDQYVLTSASVSKLTALPCVPLASKLVTNDSSAGIQSLQQPCIVPGAFTRTCSGLDIGNHTCPMNDCMNE